MAKGKDVHILNFDEYLRQGEPGKKEKAEIWRTAIGLQDVDGLKTSDYLKETAKRNIEGNITIDQVRSLITSYYNARENRNADSGQIEADKASVNIAKILKEKTFAFTLPGLVSIHKRIFDGIFKFAGRIRDYNITKQEWVLEGDTVLYVPNTDIKRAVEYDLQQEKSFSYAHLNIDQTISHLAKFISGLWQIHPFGEGNTRATAVFAIKYLQSRGFLVNNDMFAKHSWYFRNALVRANYNNTPKGISSTTVYLERFFQNLINNQKWDLRSRYLHIHPTKEWTVQPNLADRTSTGQVQDKYRTSNRVENSTSVFILLKAIGSAELSVKHMMESLGLKGRDNFLNRHLKPAISKGYIAMLYPESPRHPRQKYYLTDKGKTILRKRKQ
ncbi:MAG: Fic family protein [Bacteroidales bacterium]|nr:Fic family protein [Bacteroidales bacterium]